MRNGKKQARAINHVDFGQTDTGNDFVQLTFTILEGPEAGETIGWRGFFTEKTEQRTIEALRYCGWAGNDITNMDGLDSNVVELVVENETYEGKTHARVKWVNRLGGGIPTKNQMDPGKKAAFAARMRGAVMAVPADLAASGVKYDPARYAAQSGGTSGGDGGYDGPPDDRDPGFGDDDIPFIHSYSTHKSPKGSRWMKW